VRTHFSQLSAPLFAAAVDLFIYSPLFTHISVRFKERDHVWFTTHKINLPKFSILKYFFRNRKAIFKYISNIGFGEETNKDIVRKGKFY